jgi:hypothetical protein
MRFVIQTSSLLLPTVVMRIRKKLHLVDYGCKTRSLILLSTLKRSFEPRLHKSRAPGRRDNWILYGGACYVWVFSMKLHVSLVAPRILRWLLDFWKICALQLLTKETIWTSDGLRKLTIYDLMYQ